MKKILELLAASRVMIEGKGWHEIDGQCSICYRFIAAVNAAEQSVQWTAFGMGWQARLGRKIIALGIWLAQFGSHSKQSKLC